MKTYRSWGVALLAAIPCGALLLVVCVAFFLDRMAFFALLSLLIVVFTLVVWRLVRIKRDVRRTLSHIASRLSQTEQASLETFPLPVVVSSSKGEILWYSEQFRREVLEGNDVCGDPLTVVTGDCSLSHLIKAGAVDIHCRSKHYTVYHSQTPTEDDTLYVLYYVENTQLKQTAEEYRLSRPAVLLFYIDNMDELLQNARDSERAQISSRVEALLEDWASATTGLLRRYAADRFLLIVEQRHLQNIFESKFEILDRVRSVKTGGMGATLSIGVGQGNNFRESEHMARQAIEMALGRGGDQAAVKTRDGFDFYGGVSRGVERRTKVRTRVVASALQELLDNSDCVLAMGHRYSDLDCLGAAAAFVSSVRSLGKTAYAVVRRSQTLASSLMERYEEAGRCDLFVEPEEALLMATHKTLLVITDTHNPQLLESLELYKAVPHVVVIDHHRRMVGHIDNAVIFYHEPHASSASEMVAELVQYMGDSVLSRVDAEALLAGIMLDTRSFVIRAGVRTFEAAAYLRRMGADTVEVRRLLAGSMETYKEKADIIGNMQIYGNVAIACHEKGQQNGGALRIAAAQAADELLYIQGVDASFVLFVEGSMVHISARSLGDFNVQLVMEAMGGGGHMTMAGAQLPDTAVQPVYERLIEEVDRYNGERRRSLAAQSASQ